MLRIAYLPLAMFTGMLLSTSCKKEGINDCVTLAGKLVPQGATTYQYGTHLLITGKGKVYVLKSNTIRLQNFVEKKVILVAKNTHYRIEQGPELYNVLYLSKR